MQKKQRIFYGIFLSIALLFFGPVFISVVCQSVACSPWVLVLPALAAVCCLARRSKLLVQLRKRLSAGPLFPYVVLMVLVQLLCGYLLMVEYKVWDVYAVHKSARAFVADEPVYLPYFASYPNNNAITLALTLLYKVTAKLFGSMSVYFAVAVNIAVVDTALLFTMKAAELIGGRTLSRKVFFLSLLFAPLYLYIPIVYTDTLSMPFLSCGLYLLLYACRRDPQTRREKLTSLLCLAGSGAVIALGYCVKASLIILAIAGVIYLIGKLPIKRLLSALPAFLASFVCFMLIFSAIVTAVMPVTPEQYERSKFPITHWIMMGLHGQGNYYRDDVQFTNSFETYAERVEAITAVIRERAEELGFTGLIRHCFQKASHYAWNYGTYYAERYLGDQGDMPRLPNVLHRFVLTRGEYHLPFYIFTQGYYLTIFLGVMAALVWQLVQAFRRGGMPQAELGCAQIALLGCMLFFMLWETHPRYILHFANIFVLCGAFGLGKIPPLRLRR